MCFEKTFFTFYTQQHICRPAGRVNQRHFCTSDSDGRPDTSNSLLNSLHNAHSSGSHESHVDKRTHTTGCWWETCLCRHTNTHIDSSCQHPTKITSISISFCTCIPRNTQTEGTNEVHSPFWQESHWSFWFPEHVLQEESHCSHSPWPAHTKSVNKESDSF